jgi:mannose-6-phosphate isomerase-like protein (cupin superfamily)
MSDQLPGGVGVTRLTVYPDSGTPHLHLCCAEAYVVTGGSGSVQTLNLSGYAETALHDGAVVWFTPGTIHRLINHGDLRIVVLMQNSGLPEAGDAVFTFPPEVLGDQLAYSSAAAYPSDVQAAFTRRDLAISGFESLRDAAVAGDFEPLRAFHAAAAKLVSPHVPEWRRRWANGALRMAQDTGSHLDSLAAGVTPHFAGAAVFEMSEPTERDRRGMCGLLDTYARAA